MENQTAQPQIQEPIVDPVPVSSPSPKDNHGVMIASMAVFLLLALSATAFLYYQNQQLKSMLASYQPQSTIAPSTTTDPTANWEVYTDSKLGFTIKYPKNTFTVKPIPGTGIAINSGPLNGVTVDFQILSRGPEKDPETALKQETPRCTDEAKKLSPLGCSPSTEKFQINNAVGIRVTSHTGLDYYLSDKNKNIPVIRIVIDADKDNSNYETYKTILSTFKFVGATSSPSATPTNSY